MDLFFDMVGKYNTIIVFGFSQIGNIIMNKLEAHNIKDKKKLLYCDNSAKKQFENDVMDAKSAIDKYPQALFIIASIDYYTDIYNQLISLGISEKNIIGCPDFAKEKIRHVKAIARKTPQSVLKFLEYDVCRHCNLNCAGCNAMSPLVKGEFFTEVESAERDFRRISFLLNAKVDEIHLMGGEPLLHKDICKFAEIAYECFPNSDIMIVTNGLLLHRMSKMFWQTCAKNHIKISITRYPINIDFEAIFKIAKASSVEIDFFGTDINKTTFVLPFDLDGQQNISQNFEECIMANTCVRMRDGKLATCSPILNVDLFNNYFNQNLIISNNDYIDIYKAESGNEILSFLATPVPFCRYCNVKARCYNIPWYRSNMDIREWVL